MPSATLHDSVSVGAPQDAVWERLQEPNIWRSIGPVQEVWDPVIEDGLLTGFQWSTNIGGVVYNGTGTAVNLDPPHHYELILDTSEIAGTISVDLTEGNPPGTHIDVTVELQSKGLLSSMFFPIVTRAIGDGLANQVKDLAIRLDA